MCTLPHVQFTWKNKPAHERERAVVSQSTVLCDRSDLARFSDGATWSGMVPAEIANARRISFSSNVDDAGGSSCSWALVWLELELGVERTLELSHTLVPFAEFKFLVLFCWVLHFLVVHLLTRTVLREIVRTLLHRSRTYVAELKKAKFSGSTWTYTGEALDVDLDLYGSWECFWFHSLNWNSFTGTIVRDSLRRCTVTARFNSWWNWIVWNCLLWRSHALGWLGFLV